MPKFKLIAHVTRSSDGEKGTASAAVSAPNVSQASNTLRERLEAEGLVNAESIDIRLDRRR